MSTPYAGEIRIFGGKFAPVGWAFCDGRLLPIHEHELLFNLIGTTYGGDGVTNFALPDMRGRTGISIGYHPSQRPYSIGQAGGAENVLLTQQHLPSHTHPVAANSAASNSTTPAANVWGLEPDSKPYSLAAPNGRMNGNIVSAAGGGQSHSNMMPFITLNYIISLEGLFPSQA
ncbi:phage tail protein [Cohnella boryungensis]|uniref:Phage tail protein n=1 Tax=Cohnella boryungensis TaxID=768479 RepID=A0ABV8SDI9_9BACL